MADIFKLANLGVTDSGFDGSSLATGDIRRRYNFGNRVSELNISQDPFFRFLSKVAKNSTDDPSFKFTERRGSWQKRYGYIVGSAAWSSGSATGLTYNTAGGGDDIVAAEALPRSNTLDGTYAVAVGGDYKNAGNIQNIYGQSAAAKQIEIAESGTDPQFFIPDQLIKVPVKSLADADGAADTVDNSYQVCKIMQVENANNLCYLGLKVVSPYTLTASASHSIVFAALDWSSNAPDYKYPVDFYAKSIAGDLEARRSYVIGSAHAEGSGYPETWKDQPFSNGYGQTQIWKTAMAMTNTARATSLKYDSSEWARVWKEKLIEHKWDIEQSLLFGVQASGGDGVNYTEGAVNYCLNNGNIFGLDTATKTQDDFLDDMSNYIDPRYNPSTATVFFCDTATYNWLHKLSGYFSNNLANVQSGGFDGSSTGVGSTANSMGRAEMALSGKKNVFGIDITTINTVYGDMNLARNIHLDGSAVKMLGVNMKYCKYRPLAGNGLNRDTSVYVGVQTLENSGIDRRVDLILTEAGMQWEMPECHAIWK